LDISPPAAPVVHQPGRLARRLLARTWRLDAIAVAALAVLSTTVAYRYVNEHFALSYDSPYRDCTEDLLYPCVGHLGMTIDSTALDASPHWQDFVQRRIASLDCSALRGLPRVSAGPLSAIQRYLHASLSAVFWLRGPNRSVYVGYMTAMVGLTVLAAYGLFRLAVSPLIASLVTLPFIFSEQHLQNALHPAEYAKAPFFLACLLVVGAIVARDVGRRGAIAWSAAAGLLVGLGIGFKTDVLICVPIAIVAIAAFAPPSAGALRRTALVLTFAGAVLIAGGPVLKAQFFADAGSLFPVQVLGGMDRSFANWYAQPSLYDYGIWFDDTQITYRINSYNQRVNGSTNFAEFYSKELQTSATQLAVEIVRTFPADFLLRTFADIVNVLKLGRFGMPAAIVVVSALLLTNLRLGLCVAFLLCSAVGYVSLIFQSKHFFHLEWVPWWFTAVFVEQTIVLGALSHPVDLDTARQRARRWLGAHARRIAAMAVFIVGAVLVFALARQYQQSQVSALVTDYMRRSNDDEPGWTSDEEDGATRLVSAHGLGAAPHPTPLVEDYVVLGVECRALEDVTIVGLYEQATSPRESMTVPCSRGSRRWKVFWPVYQHPPASRFQWFEIGRTGRLRVESVRRVGDLRQVRLLLRLAVPEDYPSRRWYHTLRRLFFTEPLGLRQSF